ncbi:MAG TPA: ABC transporter ATP-binding protein [Clostridiaceae bacterium]|nr:ABC transporter ATP-binding protein [Clostridiaceae bacterium]
MTNLLRIEQATLYFGGLRALYDVTFEHRGDEILALIGPNGAGKTTLFNSITGMYKLDGGRIIFQEKDISNMRPYERVHLGIARTFQNIRLYSELTVLENLLLAHPGCNRETIWGSLLLGKNFRRNRKKVVEDCEAILELIGLSDQATQSATSLPYGKQRLLEIGRALATDPVLLLLDEPGAGMNTVEKAELTSLIKTIAKDRKRHILLIEHDMKFVLNISDRIIVLDHGEKIAEGSPEEIPKNEDVVEAYLGKQNFELYSGHDASPANLDNEKSIAEEIK